MAKRSKLAAAEQALRKAALEWPEAVEEFPWGHSAMKVKGKVFLFMSLTDKALSLSVKLPDSYLVALMLPFTSSTDYGLGKSGWVTATFGPTDDVPTPMLAMWIEESYRAIAPKKLLAEGADRVPKRKRGGAKRTK